MEKETYIIIGYICFAALCWHLTRRVSVQDPAEGALGGYPRAVALFPYYLLVYFAALIGYVDTRPSKERKTGGSQEGKLSLWGEICVLIGFIFFLFVNLFDSFKEEGRKD